MSSTKITMAELSAARAEAYYNAAHDWSANVAATLSDQATAFDNDVLRPLGEGAWSGMAADAARSKLGSVQQDLQATADYANGFTSLLTAAGDQITEAQSVLAQAQDLATQSKLAIHTDGSVTTSTGAASTSAAATQVSQLVAIALGDAQRVLDDLVPKLRNAQQFTSASGKTSPLPAAASALKQDNAIDQTMFSRSIPGSSANPTTVNAWWNAQSSSEQHYLVTQCPDLIGSLNGVPAVARNQANQIKLTAQINADKAQTAQLKAEEAQLQAEMANAESAHPPVNAHGQNPVLTQERQQLASVQRQLSAVNGQLSSLQNLQSEVAAGTTATVNGKTVKIPMYLLGYGTQDNGQAIVAVGNPDTASNVAVYVPGLGSKLSNYNQQLLNATRMTAQADQDTASTGNSVITWLGYNAPGFTSVANKSDAENATPALTSFLAGLRSVNGEMNNLSLVGDSYGSLVCGLAAANSKLPINNLLFTGSPGVGVDNVTQLKIDASHVWAGADYDDSVAALNWFGPDPAYKAFGANQFAVQHYGLGVLGTEAHSHYFDTGSESLDNITDIVTGNYPKVALDHSTDNGALYGQPGGPSVPGPFDGPVIPVPGPAPAPKPYVPPLPPA